MAQKSNQNKPGQGARRAPEGSPHESEFENAVTSEISGVLAAAFAEDRATEPNDVRITDAHLAAYVDPAADDALPPGTMLGNHFEIVELVHAGGMSLVYKAIHNGRLPKGTSKTHVAIKMMRPSVASDDEARLSLQREADKARSVSHPNIVDVVDTGEHDGRSFLVMAWLEGESVNSLLRRMRGVRLEAGLAWRVIAGLAAAVQHAHQKGVVHADINPSNIFVTESQQIKLLDFGVARFARDSDQSEDDQFAWVTKPYASPEVLSGLTPAYQDDVFSLACVAYRLLGGKHPFGGRLSLIAKHQGRLVEPIPGLADDEWQTLEKALAYERSERPGTVGDFVVLGARHASDEKRGQPKPARVKALGLAALGAVVIALGGLWFLQRGIEGEAVPQAVSPSAPSTDAVVDAPAVPVTEALLTAAMQALGDGRLLEPADDNARARYREVLAIAPDNPEALRGLRTISNEFVQQAQRALSADDPVQAYAALNIAAETDSSNPSIEIVDQLLAARASGELADARLALATGNLDLASAHLASAEQYTSIDPATVQSLRQEIEQLRQSDQVLQSLAIADAHISAGRLLSPEADNASALLLDLQAQHGDDARILASMERLGERLLTRAAFAAAAGRVAEANDLINAVEALGVLPTEVGAARTALADVETAIEPGDSQPQQALEASADIVPESEGSEAPVVVTEQSILEDTGPQDAAINTEPLAVAAISTESQAAAINTEPQAAAINTEPQAAAINTEPQPVAALNTESQAAPVNTEPQAAATDAALPPRRQSLQELGITDYVAPKFPRLADRRGLSGSVDIEFVVNVDGNTEAVEIINSEPGRVFVKSATDAVRQWRFEPRDEAIRAYVTLRFDYAP